MRFTDIVLTAFLCLGLILPLPTHAQTPSSEKASVVIDGRVLFALGSIDTVGAKERADFANDALWQVLKDTESQTNPIPVRVRERNG